VNGAAAALSFPSFPATGLPRCTRAQTRQAVNPGEGAFVSARAGGGTLALCRLTLTSCASEAFAPVPVEPRLPTGLPAGGGGPAAACLIGRLSISVPKPRRDD